MDNNKFYIGIGGQMVDINLKQTGNQLFFIRAIKEVLPEVLDETKEIYSKFEAICDSLGKERNKFLEFSVEEWKAIVKIEKEFKKWAAKWYINEDWVITVLLETFRSWYENEKSTYEFFLYDPSRGKAIKLMEQIAPGGEMKIPAFNPALITQKNYLQMVNGMLSNHIIETTNFFETHGFVHSEEKRNEGHYIWFVHFHIEGWSYDEIAHEYDKEPKAVERAVNKIYKSIGLKKENRKKESDYNI
ncbi:hypothetical protein V7201_23085 [Bacillus sp. JJ1122]|uniref:hypothetical protein n=1 Tax=Bacillus sp. JJ1122 TaxID=3122951 RepID=UPI002FFE2527